MNNFKYWRQVSLIAAGLIFFQYSYTQGLKDYSLKQELFIAKDDTNKVNILNALAYNYRNNNADSGLYFGNQAIALAQKIDWKTGLAKAYNVTGNNYFSLSDSENSIINYKKAFAIYQQLGNKDGMAQSLNYVGAVYLLLLSDYTKALPYHEKAFTLFQQVNDKTGLAVCCENIAIVYENLGNYPKALQKFQQAQSLDEQTHDNEALATNLGHLGIFYDDMEQYSKALVYCNKSLNIFQQSGNIIGVSKNLSTIGFIYLDLDSGFEALNYFTQSLKIDEQLNNKLRIAVDYQNIGMAYGTESDFTKAFKYYRQAFELEQQSGNTAGMAKVASALAYAYANAKDASIKNYNKAVQTFQYSLRIGKSIEDLELQMYDLQHLSETYEMQKNFSKALSTYKEYITVRDSMLSSEKQKEVTQKEVEYTYNKKEAVLKEQQNKKNALATAEIKKQTLIKNYTLGSVIMAGVFATFMIVSFNRRRKTKFDNEVMNVEMKALRAQMNPHFIFNSLHSINNYILENEKENASAYLSKFANLMRLILENSREQEVPLESDLQMLELYMQLEALRFGNKFKYIIETDAQLDKENTLIPPMLLQPFVENAILHGMKNKEDGLIKIKVEKDDEMIRCIIEDNGKEISGITSGTSQIKTHKSLSGKIIDERLNIINRLKKVKASVSITDLKDDQSRLCGMRVELLLPLETAG